MVCRACGRIIVNENANFCEYCGTSVDGRGGDTIFGGADAQQEYRFGSAGPDRRENAGYGGREGSAERQQSYPGAGGLVGVLSGTAGLAEAEPSMSFVHWIVIMLLPYIPMVGSIAYLVLLSVWAFGRTASTTRKNWARANLLMMAIGLILMLTMLPSLMEMISDGDISSVLNSLLNGRTPQ